MRILYAWEWGAGAGHLRRFVPLAMRLREAGHHVTIASKELHRLPQLFPSGDFRWMQAPDSGRASLQVVNASTFADVTYNLGFDSADKVLAVLGAWHEIFCQHRPDLVIADFGVACSWIAAALGVPVVRIGTGYSCPPRGAHSTAFQVGVEGGTPNAETILARVASAMQTIGLRRDASWDDVLLPSHQTLLATIPPLDPYDGLRLSHEYSGVWDHDGQVQPHWQGLGKYRAVAYLKPFPHLPQLLASLHSSAIETVLYGDGIPDELIRPVRNPLLRLSDVPLRLSDLSHTCDMVFCNANHGTTAKALCQGIPVVAIPLFLEQRVTASRVQGAGWGVSVDARRPDQFMAKIIEATSETVRQTASRFPSEVAPFTGRGLEHAWQKLESFLR